MTADAYATALMVLPLEKGQELIASATNLEAYWIVSQGSTTLEVTTKGW
jgi:thiamine biosynthesis lipoprotein ApbE